MVSLTDLRQRPSLIAKIPLTMLLLIGCGKDTLMLWDMKLRLQPEQKNRLKYGAAESVH